MSTAISSRPVRSRKPVKSFYDDAKRELDSSQESSKGKTSIDENVKSTSQSPKRYATRGSLSPSSKKRPAESAANKSSGKKSIKKNDDILDLEYEMMSTEEEAESDDDEFKIDSTKKDKSKKSKPSPKSNNASKKNASTQPLNDDSPLIKNRRTPSKLDHSGNNKSQGESIPVKSPMLVIAKKVLTNDTETPELSLLASLLYAKRRSKDSTGTDVRKIAQNVFDDIQKDANHAHIDLLNLIFRSVGGRFDHLLDYGINLDTLPEEDLASSIQLIVEDMKETPADSILLCADPEGAMGSRVAGNQRSKAAMKEYRQIFQQFWYELGTLFVDALNNENSGKPEVDLVEIANSLVARLTDLVYIGVPDIRAAVAIAIYQIALALLEGTVLFQNKLKMANRQLQSAKRVRASPASRKANALEQQVKQLEEAISSLEDLVKEDVINVFLKRYRDKNEHIRAESLKALSSFSLIRPDIFLCSNYLKYFGWMLSDKNANVRTAAVMGFLAPFRGNKRLEEDETAIHMSSKIEIGSMTSAIKKFIARLADCIIDVDMGVQEVASELLLFLVQKDLFDDIDNDNMWYQINSRAISPDASLTVRRNSLYFIMEQLQPFDSSATDPDTEAVERIRALVQWTAHVLSDSDILIEHMRFELTDLIIESLRSMPEHKQLVCNWAAILRALKGDEPNKNTRMSRKSIGKGDQRSDAVQQRVVLRWLVTSAESEVRSLSSYGGPMMQDIDPALIEIQRKLNGASKNMKRKDLNRTSTSHESLTCALLRALPDLLISFKSETLVMQSLTSLPRFLLPNAFNLRSRKEDFHSLVSILSKVFLEVTDEVVLCNCALSLISLTRGDHARKDDALLLLKKTTSLLVNRLLELCEATSEDDHEESNSQSNFALLDTKRSLNLCLRRLRIISKLSYLPDLLSDSIDEEAEKEHLENIFSVVFNRLSKELSDRMPITQAYADEVEIPEIWTVLDEKVHSVVGTSVSDALDLLLSLTAWKVCRFLESLKTQNEVNDDEFDSEQSEFILKLRRYVTNLVLLCFEHFIEKDHLNKVSDCQQEFATSLQEYAIRVTGDLRMIFPKSWKAAKAKCLADLALVDEFGLVGGIVRFVHSQDYKLRECQGGVDNADVARTILLPLARGIAGNWKDCNRKEAGILLSHIHGSGKEAHNLVQSFSRVCKKIHPVRLLEAHMTHLRGSFKSWKFAQPEDPENENPTEEELEEFTKADDAHKKKLASMESIAVRLSASLGVGNISDKSLVPPLAGFVCEGIRFAFSNGADKGDEAVLLGERLTFLIPLSKYLNWIRQNKGHKERVKKDVNKRENDLRHSAGYEEIYEEDKAAIILFRQVGELGDFEEEIDDDEGTSAKSTVHSNADIDDDEGTNAKSTAHTNADSTMEGTDNNVSQKRKSSSARSSNAGGGTGSVSSASLKSKYSSSQSLSPLEEADKESESSDDDDENAAASIAADEVESDRSDNSSKSSEHKDDQEGVEHNDQEDDEIASKTSDHDDDEISQLSISPQKKRRTS